MARYNPLMLSVKRAGFGILALAGVLVVVGCSKKKQEAAADSAVEATNSVAAAVTAGAGASLAPALAAAVASDLSHPIGSGWTWNAGNTQISRSVSKQGMTGTLVRRGDAYRLVISVRLLGRGIAADVDACDVEPA